MGIPSTTARRRILRKVSGRRLAITPETRARLPGRRLRFQLLAPQYQCVCGFNSHRKQPAGMLTDGSTISLY
ncbi:MAG: hypothetical protein ACREWG_11800 [Gammaproteobacteria bacterium]